MALETPSNATQPVTSASGSQVDGHSATIGGTADAAWSGSGAGTVVALLKAIWTRLRGGQATMANSLPVTLASDQGAVSVSVAAAIPAGNNNIGDVDVVTLPSLPTGSNTIGTVNTLDPDTTTSGTITATDAVVAAPAGAGAVVTGTSTAGSYVALACQGGDSAWNIQITGLTSGTLYFEESLDSTNGIDGNWINVNGRQTGIVNTVLSGNATANGVYRGNTSGAKYIRVRSVGALTGTPAIVIRISGGVGAVFLNASVPAGTNIIGQARAIGDVDHDAVNTGLTVQVGGHATNPDVPPTAVSAADRVRGWYDKGGAAVIRSRRHRESYTAVCRLAETTARLDPTFTHTANTNKQLVTLHHTAASTRDLYIRKVVLYATLLGTAAGFWTVELRYITGTPATGAPAITPIPHRQGANATEAVCLTLPTTAGTDSNANSPLGSFTVDHGIEATTQPTAHPLAQGLTAGYPFTLYDASQEDPEVLPPVLRAGSLEGIAINSRDTAAMVLRFWAVIRYTEETP